MVCVAETVIAVADERRLVGDGWSLRVNRLEVLDSGDWRALIGVRRCLTLLVTGSGQANELDGERGPVPCQNSHNGSELVFSALVRPLPILVDQPVDDLPTPDPAGDVDRLAGLMQRRSLSARLVRAMLVVMPCVLGQDPP